jgi:hypothetical protein
MACSSTQSARKSPNWTLPPDGHGEPWDQRALKSARGAECGCAGDRGGSCGCEGGCSGGCGASGKCGCGGGSCQSSTTPCANTDLRQPPRYLFAAGNATSRQNTTSTRCCRFPGGPTTAGPAGPSGPWVPGRRHSTTRMPSTGRTPTLPTPTRLLVVRLESSHSPFLTAPRSDGPTA